jgi:hypothetical protein
VSAGPDDPVARGLQQILDRRWFEAHETLEVPWRAAVGERRAFLQGLIQAAVSLEHLRRGNPRGCRGLFRKARARFEGLPEVLEGVHVRAWERELAAFYETIDLDARIPAQFAGTLHTLPLPPEEVWPLPQVDRPLAPPQTPPQTTLK